MRSLYHARNLQDHRQGQTTVPRAVRTALKSNPGDLIAWEIEPNRRIAVRVIQSLAVEYLQAIQDTLCEWATAEDENAYGSL